MINMFLVMGGGAVGAALRYQVGRAAAYLLPGAAWPWGTFAVNVIGGLAMGLLAGLLARHGSAGGEAWRLILGVGVLGGFTTFSSFSLETMLMIERGKIMVALGYALVSVVGAVAALALGLSIARGVA